MTTENNVGTELAYPSMPAGLLAAVLVTLLGITIGQLLIDGDVIEVSLRDWLPFLLPFFYLLPDWAREAPWVLGALGAIAVLTVRLLAGSLPRAALYILIVGVFCAALLLGLPIHVPTSPDEWAFAGYVILIALLGGAPRSYHVAG
jgi:hypothetical protein